MLTTIEDLYVGYYCGCAQPDSWVSVALVQMGDLIIITRRRGVVDIVENH